MGGAADPTQQRILMTIQGNDVFSLHQGFMHTGDYKGLNAKMMRNGRGNLSKDQSGSIAQLLSGIKISVHFR